MGRRSGKPDGRLRALMRGSSVQNAFVFPALDFAGHPALPGPEAPAEEEPAPFEGFTVEEDESDVPARHPAAVESLKRAAEALNGGSKADEDADIDPDFEGFVEQNDEPDPEGAADDLRAALND